MHKLEIGRKRRAAFLEAFADVYSKYALLEEDNEGKICAAAEDVYATLAEADAWDAFNERAALGAVIYRESRIAKEGVAFAEICKRFGADRIVAQRILDFMI